MPINEANISALYRVVFSVCDGNGPAHDWHPTLCMSLEEAKIYGAYVYGVNLEVQIVRLYRVNVYDPCEMKGLTGIVDEENPILIATYSGQGWVWGKEI